MTSFFYHKDTKKRGKILLMKKKTYQLKDLSYSGLSMSYIGLIIFTFVTCIILAAFATMKNSWVMVLVWMGLGLGIIISIVRIGSTYGDHGLAILFAKLFQPKHIRNDFPIFEQYLVVEEQEVNQEKEATAISLIP